MNKEFQMNRIGYIEDTFAINNNNIVIKDSVTGDILDSNKISSILKDSCGEGGCDLPKSIIVEIEATHNGITKNDTEYLSDKMKKSAKTFVTPYNKPVLIDHNSYRPALGRVKKQEFTKSVLSPDKDTIKLTLEITDPESIRRHLDGTALTYSIGAIAKEVWCKICGTNVLESCCGHWKGNTYSIKKNEEDKPENVKCIWQIGECEYIEVSEVNVPADQWAQLLTVKVKEEEPKGKEDDEEDSVKVPVTTDNVTVTPETSINSIIDNLTSENTEPTVIDSTTPAPVTEPVTENVPTSIITDSATTTETTKTVEELTKELKEANDKLASLTLELKTAKEELDTVNITLSESVIAKEALNKELTDLIEKSKNTFAINVEMAKTIKKVYAESIVDARIVLGQVEEANRQSFIDSIVIKSATELSSMLIELREQSKNRSSLPAITQANIGDEGALLIHQDGVDLTDKDKSVKKDNKPITAADAVEKVLKLNRKI